ncbi:MBL fold metallo-hydrolase [Dokdonella soli]|uniref:MBL fold metallo-hydrolase n=1 Tax=Dokdonella soli TaxID=529810 RepID=A0ABN1IZ59_9GAMM
MKMTYIGGPTALIEIAGLRILTDPTFDPPGGEYQAAAYSLFKTQDPAITRASVGHVDVVLLSHDHHFDNLDTSGRAMLSDVATVLTTQAGAERLGAPTRGLVPWQTHELALPDGGTLRITATPARHGPVDGDRGPVIGFVLQRLEDPSSETIYVSGDTVWYDGVAEVARRFPVTVAVLNMGAAHVAVAGPSHLTFTATEGVEFTRAFPTAIVVPLHYEGWAHFSESRREIDDAFRASGLDARLRWLQPGAATPIASLA